MIAFNISRESESYSEQDLKRWVFSIFLKVLTEEALRTSMGRLFQRKVAAKMKER